MMKKMFLAFTTLLLTVNLANADFIPGRVRVSAEGELNAEIKAVGGLKGTTSLIKLEGYPNYNLLTQ